MRLAFGAKCGRPASPPVCGFAGRLSRLGAKQPRVEQRSERGDADPGAGTSEKLAAGEQQAAALVERHNLFPGVEIIIRPRTTASSNQPPRRDLPGASRVIAGSRFVSVTQLQKPRLSREDKELRQYPWRTPVCARIVGLSSIPKPASAPTVKTRSANRRGRGRKLGSALRGLIPQTHFTTVIILALNFGLFVASLLLSMKLGSESMMSIPVEVLVVFGAKYGPPMVRQEQWWRLVTAGFLHGGVFHILMNSWVLLDLGSHAEAIFGTPRYLVIYWSRACSDLRPACSGAPWSLRSALPPPPAD